MIFFDGYQQQYHVEELSYQQAVGILTEQLINKGAAEESNHEIINHVDGMINRSYSYCANFKKSGIA